jgi:hypothetical protein
MPLFVPSNSSKYYDASQHPRFKAQSIKEDMWAAQYFALLDQFSHPIQTVDDAPVIPEGMRTYVLMTYNAGHDAASNDFYRDIKVKYTNHMARGNLTKPIVWCTDPDCSGDFPVAKAAWTAEALMSFGF